MTLRPELTIPKNIAHNVIVFKNWATEPDLRLFDKLVLLPPLVRFPIPFWTIPLRTLDKPPEDLFPLFSHSFVIEIYRSNYLIYNNKITFN